MNEIFTVIEIGTDRIRVVIASFAFSDGPRILGTGSWLTNMVGEGDGRASYVRKGEIRNADAVRGMLNNAVRMAEKASGVKVASGQVFVGVSSEVHSRNVNYALAVKAESGVISLDDLTEAGRALLESAELNADATEYCIQRYIQYYKVDDGRELFTPKGVSSRTLTVFAQGMMAPKFGQVEAVKQLVAKVTAVVPEVLYLPLAAGASLNYESSIKAEDMEAGILSLDLGAGVMSYCITVKGNCVDAGHIKVGCNHIENDLMTAFGIEWDTALKLMRKLDSVEVNANVVNSGDGRSRLISLGIKDPRGGRDRKLPVSSIERVVMLRLNEMFTILHRQLKERKLLHFCGGGVVLSGGGALIPGVDDLCASVFRMNSRISSPVIPNEGGLFTNDARDAVPLGLVKLAYDVWLAADELEAAASKKLNWWERLKRAVNW